MCSDSFYAGIPLPLFWNPFQVLGISLPTPQSTKQWEWSPQLWLADLSFGESEVNNLSLQQNTIQRISFPPFNRLYSFTTGLFPPPWNGFFFCRLPSDCHREAFLAYFTSKRIVFKQFYQTTQLYAIIIVFLIHSPVLKQLTIKTRIKFHCNSI